MKSQQRSRKTDGSTEAYSLLVAEFIFFVAEFSVRNIEAAPVHFGGALLSGGVYVRFTGFWAIRLLVEQTIKFPPQDPSVSLGRSQLRLVRKVPSNVLLFLQSRHTSAGLRCH